MNEPRKRDRDERTGGGGKGSDGRRDPEEKKRERNELKPLLALALGLKSSERFLLARHLTKQLEVNPFLYRVRVHSFHTYIYIYLRPKIKKTFKPFHPI